MTLTLDKLSSAVANAAALRRARRLQPTAGPGEKIFPPTYPGQRQNDPPRHVFETRRIDGHDVLCVLIDSVQSQANRLEEALRAARESKLIKFPLIAVDFSKTEIGDIGSITTLDAPHRVFDAIIRDSELSGTRFRETELGRRLIAARAEHARAVYELSPTALIFGAWNSTGEGGGLGAKFPRCLVSEIVGVGVATEPELDTRTGELAEKPSGQRTGSRIDPLGIVSAVKVYRKAGAEGEWTVMESEAERRGNTAVLYTGKKRIGKAGRPSLINHGSVTPSVQQLGVSVDYALHNFVLSFAALRRLHFGAAKADLAAQTALAALALAAVTSQDRVGYFLRSRCDLVPQENSPKGFELIDANGHVEKVELESSQASTLAREAADAAKAVGLEWNDADVLLTPQARLVQLVVESRRLALAGEVEPETDEDSK